MAAKRTSNDQQLMRPATTPEGRENQLIALATNLVEKRLRDGTATSQEVCHFLKMASPREQMERQKMRYESELLQARTENIANSERMIDLADKALRAFRQYAGQPDEDDEDAQDV
jgi:hypothetical protein